MEFKEFFIINEVEIILDEAEQSLNWSKYVDPSTGKKWRQEQRIDQLRKVVNNEVAKGTQPNKIWVTFSSLPKLGINPERREHGAPHGIYAYPASYVIKREGKVPYGGNREYMVVFKVNGPVLKAERLGVDDEKLKTLASNIKKVMGKPLDISLKGLELKLSDYIDEKILPKYLQKMEDDPRVQEFAEVGRDLVNRFINYLVRLYQEDKDVESVKNALPKNVEGLKDTFRKDARGWVKGTIENVSFGPDYEKRYVLNDDDTITLTPQYEKYLKIQKEERPNTDMPMYNFIGKKLSMDEAFKLDRNLEYSSGFFEYYKNIKNYMDSAPMRALMKGLLFKLKKFFEKFKTPDLASVKFPFREKFVELAKKYNLDLEQALRDGLNKSNVTGFVYAVARTLSTQMAAKDNKSTAAVWWNKFIRELGISSIVDPEGTGTIHGAESTQGAFLDASKLEQIAVIENRQSHVDTTERTGRPPLSTPESVYDYYRKNGLDHEAALQLSKEPFKTKWDDDKHYRQPLTQQRIGWRDTPGPFDKLGKIGYERALIQVYAKIKRIKLQLAKYVYGYTRDESPPNVEEGDPMRLSSYLVVLTKLVKTAKSISNAGIKHRALDLINQDVEEIREMLWKMTKGSNLPPEEEQQLTYIIGTLGQFLSGQTAKTPIFSRIPQWKGEKIYNAFNQYPGDED